jgi:hypothetical protein
MNTKAKDAHRSAATGIAGYQSRRARQESIEEEGRIVKTAGYLQSVPVKDKRACVEAGWKWNPPHQILRNSARGSGISDALSRPVQVIQ